MGSISFLLQAANWIVFFIRLTISTDREVENDWKKKYHTYTFKYPNLYTTTGQDILKNEHDIYQIWKWTFKFFFHYTTVSGQK